MSIELEPKKDRARTIAAILAAINSYIEAERALEIEGKSKRPSVQVKIWPMLGREEMMRMRSMWQRRLV